MHGTPKTIRRDQIVYALDRASPSALQIVTGKTIVFETHDARTGTIRSSRDLLDHPHPDGSIPATGPVSVTSAQPVDSLTVKILDIELADSAFVAVKQGVGLLSDRARDSATRVVEIRDGSVHFATGICFPVRPMVGVIGTAPATAAVETAYPGPHGGNMDNRYVTTGSTIHLPIAVPGALLALGDVHASMGDGEITMVGLEAAARVTVRISLVRGVQVTRPWIERPECWVTTGDAKDPAEALRIAACDIQICQACAPGRFPVTTRAVFPRTEGSTP